MKVSKVAASTARRIFSLCQTDGRLDEEKLSKAVKKIAAEKPRDFRGVLVSLKRLVRLELQRNNVLIESATELDEATRQKVQSDLNAKHGAELNFEYRTNPELLGGLKVRIGNDVWDGSVKGRLDRLAEAF
ncbi:MAG: F0F1 ATP synthase subunit delta [Haloferula sp.]